MKKVVSAPGYHVAKQAASLPGIALLHPHQRTYTFQNHFHPFVAQLLERLNRGSVDGLLDLKTQKLHEDFFQALYAPNPDGAADLDVRYPAKDVDFADGGPYAVYNWELYFHVPLTVAVQLSRNQRFADAQRWFHYVFDPTCNDTSVPPRQRYWKFLRFREADPVLQIDDLLRLLARAPANPAEDDLQKSVLNGLNASYTHPFQPHAIARTRTLAYQYCVVMKYLDNLIAWGDSLFLQDTGESVAEATQVYVLAANILGPRPQRIPPSGRVRPKSFKQLKAAAAKQIDAMGNALVEMEGQFPFSLYTAHSQGAGPPHPAPAFGIGHTLYFSIPQNEKLLGYWDTVADRLFKIRHCMNIGGVVRQLALFDPPIDPGLLVKAAAAGIDVGSLVSGLNQPPSPVRATLLLQKALELCAEVRALGGALLSAVEKKEGEHLALLRQKHEIHLQELAQDARYLQWQEARASTEALLRSRESAVERYRHAQHLIGKSPDESASLAGLSLERKKLTEETFDEIYQEMVGKYAPEPPAAAYPGLKILDLVSPTAQVGGGDGKLALTVNEHVPLNVLAPVSHSLRTGAAAAEVLGSVLALIPDLRIQLAYWGMGGKTKVFDGKSLAMAAHAGATSLNLGATTTEGIAAGMTQTASYERRLDDWVLQNNLAARELAQIGRQIVSSLIREEITRHDYESHKAQIEQSRQVDEFLRGKFAGEELYGWMQGELSKLYYEYYRLAFDGARRAEQAVKRELMRTELDGTSFVAFNYWDGGRKGLLAGEKLHLDLKRLETAYHENNRREYELARHVSLRQLAPLALLELRATGKCEVAVPEWLFDLDCPGHFLRRLRSVSVYMPSVAGPYTPVSCTLTLLQSTVRRSPDLAPDYARAGSDDSRFLDYAGGTRAVVTSGGADDAGLFEPGARDERYLPFEGEGAESTWRLELPKEYRQFDYDTISDVVLHLRYTAREGGGPLRTAAVTHLGTLLKDTQGPGLAQLLSLKHEFPSEWQQFVAGPTGTILKVGLRKEHFPYLAQVNGITITGVDLLAPTGPATQPLVLLPPPTSPSLPLTLTSTAPVAQLTSAVPPDDKPRYLLVRYSLS
jgi:hypothetical protein